MHAAKGHVRLFATTGFFVVVSAGFLLFSPSSLHAAGKAADAECPAPNANQGYNSSKSCGETYEENGKKKVNLYGCQCSDSSVRGICTKVDFCLGKSCLNNGTWGSCKTPPNDLGSPSNPGKSPTSPPTNPPANSPENSGNPPAETPPAPQTPPPASPPPSSPPASSPPSSPPPAPGGGAAGSGTANSQISSMAAQPPFRSYESILGNAFGPTVNTSPQGVFPTNPDINNAIIQIANGVPPEQASTNSFPPASSAVVGQTTGFGGPESTAPATQPVPASGNFFSNLWSGITNFFGGTEIPGSSPSGPTDEYGGVLPPTATNIGTAAPGNTTFPAGMDPASQTALERLLASNAIQPATGPVNAGDLAAGPQTVTTGGPPPEPSAGTVNANELPPASPGLTGEQQQSSIDEAAKPQPPPTTGENAQPASQPPSLWSRITSYFAGSNSLDSLITPQGTTDQRIGYYQQALGEGLTDPNVQGANVNQYRAGLVDELSNRISADSQQLASLSPPADRTPGEQDIADRLTTEINADRQLASQQADALNRDINNMSSDRLGKYVSDLQTLVSGYDRGTPGIVSGLYSRLDYAQSRLDSMSDGSSAGSGAPPPATVSPGSGAPTEAQSGVTAPASQPSSGNWFTNTVNAMADTFNSMSSSLRDWAAARDIQALPPEFFGASISPPPPQPTAPGLTGEQQQSSIDEAAKPQPPPTTGENAQPAQQPTPPPENPVPLPTPRPVTAGDTTPISGQPIDPSPNGKYELGDKSPQITQIQEFLANNGYPVGSALNCPSSGSCPGAPGQFTDEFGAKTLAAVKAYQAANGLTVDGVVGPQTLAAMNQAINNNVASVPTAANASPGLSPTSPFASYGTENLFSAGSNNAPSGYFAAGLPELNSIYGSAALPPSALPASGPEPQLGTFFNPTPISLQPPSNGPENAGTNVTSNLFSPNPTIPSGSLAAQLPSDVPINTFARPFGDLNEYDRVAQQSSFSPSGSLGEVTNPGGPFGQPTGLPNQYMLPSGTIVTIIPPDDPRYASVHSDPNGFSNAGEIVGSKSPIVVDLRDSGVAILKGEDYGRTPGTSIGVAASRISDDRLTGSGSLVGIASLIDPSVAPQPLQNKIENMLGASSGGSIFSAVNPDTGGSLGRDVGTLLGASAERPGIGTYLSDNYSLLPPPARLGVAIQFDQPSGSPLTLTYSEPIPFTDVSPVKASSVVPDSVPVTIVEAPPAEPPPPEPLPEPKVEPPPPTTPPTTSPPATSPPATTPPAATPPAVAAAPPPASSPPPQSSAPASPPSGAPASEPSAPPGSPPSTQPSQAPTPASNATPNWWDPIKCALFGCSSPQPATPPSSPPSTAVAATQPPVSQPKQPTQPSQPTQPGTSQPGTSKPASSPGTQPSKSPPPKSPPTPPTPIKVASAPAAKPASAQPASAQPATSQPPTSPASGGTAGTASPNTNPPKFTNPIKVVAGTISTKGAPSAPASAPANTFRLAVLTSLNGTERVPAPADNGNNPKAGGAPGTPGVKTGGQALGNTGTNPNKGQTTGAPNQAETATGENGPTGQQGGPADTTNQKSPNPSATPKNQNTNSAQNGAGGGTGGSGNGNGTGTGSGNGSEAGVQGQACGTGCKIEQALNTFFGFFGPNGANAAPVQSPTLKQKAARDLAIAGAGLATASGLSWWPNPQQLATMRAGTQAAQRMTDTLQKLGNYPLATEWSDYYKLISSMQDPANQTSENFTKGKTMGADVVNKTQTFLKTVPDTLPPSPPPAAKPAEKPPAEPPAGASPPGSRVTTTVVKPDDTKPPAAPPPAAPPGTQPSATPVNPPKPPASSTGVPHYTVLAQARARIGQELNDPGVRRLLMASGQAETGGQGSKALQAYFESVINRATARNHTLVDELTNKYYPYYPAATINRLGATFSPDAQAKTNAIIDDVLAGSNISNLATGNESGKNICFGQCVAITFDPGTGERFVLERGYQAHPDSIWRDTVQGQLGQPEYKPLPGGQIPPQYRDGATSPSIAPGNPGYHPGITRADSCPASGLCYSDAQTGVFGVPSDPNMTPDQFNRAAAADAMAERLAQAGKLPPGAQVKYFTATPSGNTAPANPTPQDIRKQVTDYLSSKYQPNFKDTLASKMPFACGGRNCTDVRDYVIGGMQTNLQDKLFSLGKQLDAQGIEWKITSGFRDNYRQDIASGYKASTGGSLHGNTPRTLGYSDGQAVDLDGPDRAALFGAIDKLTGSTGLYRPIPDLDGPDPFHVIQNGNNSMLPAIQQQIGAQAAPTPTYDITSTDENGQTITWAKGVPLPSGMVAPDGTVPLITDGDGNPLGPDGKQPLQDGQPPLATTPPPQGSPDPTNPDKQIFPDGRPEQPQPKQPPPGPGTGPGTTPGPQTGPGSGSPSGGSPSGGSPSGGQPKPPPPPPPQQPPQQSPPQPIPQPLPQPVLTPPPTPQLSCTSIAAKGTQPAMIAIKWSCLQGSASSTGFATGGSPSGQTSVPQNGTNSFSLSCISGSQQSPIATCNVSAATTKLSANLIANPTTVMRGGKAVLTWSSIGASSCTVTDKSGTQIAKGGATGTSNTPALTAISTFAVTCTSSSGANVTASTTVKIR
jgi:hypothetical protein